ncbi:MAG: hypothetical protein NUV80_07540 [Candidatus Berkelbacteria bacterium]|nr:hypothetical protein [Candidatus Berkelbacteria bacterium]
MTVTCSVNTVATSIAGLTITGVTIKDITAIPDSANMLCPILIPQPNGYMSNTSMTFETFGSNGTAKMNMEYDLNYVYLHCEAGSGVNAFAPFSSLMTNLAAILVVILSNDKVNGLVDMKLGSVGEIGIINDPAGNSYWGVLFSLHCLEYVQ